MGMGKTLTHKKLAFQNYKKKIPTSENAKLIDHTPESVDRYTKDGMRVEKLCDEGYEEWEIAFFTGLPGYVVKQLWRQLKNIRKRQTCDFYPEKGHLTLCQVNLLLRIY
jgi:hypothetical protein